MEVEAKKAGEAVNAAGRTLVVGGGRGEYFCRRRHLGERKAWDRRMRTAGDVWGSNFFGKDFGDVGVE